MLLPDPMPLWLSLLLGFAVAPAAALGALAVLHLNRVYFEKRSFSSSGSSRSLTQRRWATVQGS